MARKFLSTLTLLGLPIIAFGQSVTLSVGSGPGTPGGTVDLPITLSSSGGAQPASLQWSFSFSSDITGVTVVAGPSAINAGKSISCSANNCLLVGFNSNVMADGTVAVATFQIAASPSSNPIPIQLTSLVASTAGGTSITASGVAGAISLPGSVTALSAVNCTSSTINTPGSTPCSVTLTSAASGAGFAVSLSSNNANLTLPSSVTVASGQTTGSFTATGAQVSSNQSAMITATAGAVTRTATLSLVAPPQPTSLACLPSTLGSNASSTCTVTLNTVASGAAVVALGSNNGLLSVPATVTVVSGQSTATFAATSGSVPSNQSATVTATLNGQSQQSTISLTAATAQLTSLSCSPGTVNAPGTSTCTATLTAAATNTVSVTLSSNNANVTVPGSVSIGTGLSSATFTATVAAVGSDQSAVLTASLNGTSKTFTLTASAPTQLTSVSCVPSTLGSNSSSTCTVGLNKAAASAASISLNSSNALLTVPASVTVLSGQSTATFAAASGSVSSNQNAIVTASFNGQNQQTTISLAAAVQLSSLNCSPGTVNAPGVATCTVALTGATSGAVNITLLSNNTSVTIPGSVNIGAGQSSAPFTATVAAVVSNQTAVLTASLNGISQTFTLTANANATTQLTSVACTPSSLGSNAASTCTVMLSAAATNPETVSLSSGNVLLAVPSSVTVPVGQSAATFTATSGIVGSSQNATVTAALNGLTQQTVISLVGAAVQLSSLSCSPATVSGPGAATCAATLTASTASSANVTLSSGNPNVTVPASVNIAAGFNSATFTATVAAVASSQTALLTATLDGVSQTFTLNANAGTPLQITSLACARTTLGNNASSICTVALSSNTANAVAVSLSSSHALLSVPPSVTVPGGQSIASFTATAGIASGSQSVTITATFGDASKTALIQVVPGFAPNCQEFQVTPEGLCTIQDVLPWITFGGGWESRLKIGNIPSGSGGGAIQIGFTLLPASGGVQNHMPAFFRDNRTGMTQLGESAAYVVALGESVSIDFLSPPGGCNNNGLMCWGSPDPSVISYGSVLVKYISDNPVYLRGIAKAQLTSLANGANGNYGWQISEREMPPANLWTAPVAVSASQNANPQTNQEASAALANPGLGAITVRGTLYDESGAKVTFRDIQIPPLGSVALVFSRNPALPFGGFGDAMFPQGQDFRGLVTFQVISPSSATMSAMVLQYVGSAMSTVELNSQGSIGFSVANGAGACAEFATATDGTCTVQYSLPWVVFGGGWESRLKAANSPGGGSASPVQVSFTLLPASPASAGGQNHLPAYFTDGRNAPMHAAESASYTLGAGQSVDIHFLYPPAGCDSHGQNCADQADPGSLSYGSVMVQFASSDPAALRKLAKPQLAFLARPDGASYAAQMTEHAAVVSRNWTAPVAISANQYANPQTNEEASAAIANPGPTPVTVRGTLRDRSGAAVTYQDFQVPASGTIGIVFSQDANQPFGGFGTAFTQGRDFDGWVTFEVTSPSDGGVTVLVLQYVGDTVSSVNVQSFP